MMEASACMRVSRCNEDICCQWQSPECVRFGRQDVAMTQTPHARVHNQWQPRAKPARTNTPSPQLCKKKPASLAISQAYHHPPLPTSRLYNLPPRDQKTASKIKYQLWVKQVCAIDISGGTMWLHCIVSYLSWQTLAGTSFCCWSAAGITHTPPRLTHLSDVIKQSQALAPRSGQ